MWTPNTSNTQESQGSKKPYVSWSSLLCSFAYVFDSLTACHWIENAGRNKTGIGNEQNCYTWANRKAAHQHHQWSNQTKLYNVKPASITCRHCRQPTPQLQLTSLEEGGLHVPQSARGDRLFQPAVLLYGWEWCVHCTWWPMNHTSWYQTQEVLHTFD